MKAIQKAPETQAMIKGYLSAYPQNEEDHHTDCAMDHLEAKTHSALEKEVEEKVPEINM